MEFQVSQFVPLRINKCTGAAHKRDDNFTIGVGFEVERLLETRSQFYMVVDLSVDCKNDLSIVAHERLGPSI